MKSPGKSMTNTSMDSHLPRMKQLTNLSKAFSPSSRTYSIFLSTLETWMIERFGLSVSPKNLRLGTTNRYLLSWTFSKSSGSPCQAISCRSCVPRCWGRDSRTTVRWVSPPWARTFPLLSFTTCHSNSTSEPKIAHGMGRGNDRAARWARVTKFSENASRHLPPLTSPIREFVVYRVT